MRNLLLIATLSLSTLLWTIPSATAETAASAHGQNDVFRHTVASQVNDYQHAKQIATPGKCERSTAEFVRIGEYGSGNVYDDVLAAQVERYRLENEAIAPSAAAELTNASGTLPAAMAAHEQKRNNARDWYAEKIAAQSKQIERTEKAEVPNL